MDVIEFLLFGYGIYVIYLHIRMKQTGEISSTLLSNKINLDRAKDIPGYIEYTYLKGIIFGAFVSVCSAIILLVGYLSWPAWIGYITEIIFLIVLIVNSVFLIKAQKKFLV